MMGEVVTFDPDKDEFIESFDHDGITVTVLQSRLTKRFIGKFVDTRPLPFQTTSMQIADVRRKIITMIDKLHGRG